MRNAVVMVILSVCVTNDIAHGTDQIYWTGGYGEDRSVQRADITGGNIETLVSGYNTPSGIAVDLSAGKMYWGEFWAGKIMRANLDGSNVESIITTGQACVWDVEIDRSAGKLYWTDPYGRSILRANVSVHAVFAKA